MEKKPVHPVWNVLLVLAAAPWVAVVLVVAIPFVFLYFFVDMLLPGNNTSKKEKKKESFSDLMERLRSESVRLNGYDVSKPVEL